MSALSLLLICLFVLSCPVSSLARRARSSLSFFRFTPDDGLHAVPGLSSVQIDFSEPVTTNEGNILVYQLNSAAVKQKYKMKLRNNQRMPIPVLPHVLPAALPVSFDSPLLNDDALLVATIPVVSPFVLWKDATVTIQLDRSVSPVNTTLSIVLPAGAFIGSVTGGESAAVNLGEWIITIDPNAGQVYPSNIPSQPSQSEYIQPLISQLSTQNMNDTVSLVSSYYNRFFNSDSGAEAAHLLANLYLGEIQQSGRTDISVSFFQHAWKMPSLIVRIEGSESKELVIVGAHLDSINRQNWTVNFRSGPAPGANDDGTGIAALLDVFRVLLGAGFKPKRTLELHAYAGEEEGLYGSADVSADYVLRGNRVAAMLQLDQCGWVRNQANSSIAIFTDNTDVALTAVTKLILNSYTTLPLVVSNENGRADSDFHSWTKNGARAVYFAEGPVDDVVYGNSKHTPHDTIEGVDFQHVVQIAAGALGFIVELSMYSS